MRIVLFVLFMIIVFPYPARACSAVESGAGYADCLKWDKDRESRNIAKLQKQRAVVQKDHDVKVQECLAADAKTKHAHGSVERCSRKVRFQERSKGR